MIHILDCGLGNSGSVQNSLRRIGCPSLVSGRPDQLSQASALILPGVGAFDEAMRRVRQLGLESVLCERVSQAKIPVLGICLGLQLMASRSEEGKGTGLQWLDAEVVKLAPEGQALPNIGWRPLDWALPSCEVAARLQSGIAREARFYFTHSYRLQPRPGAATKVLALSRYGQGFPAVVAQDNIVGTQFHPEKSGCSGLRFLRNFVEHL